jgi:hypothetical protein
MNSSRSAEVFTKAVVCGLGWRALPLAFRLPSEQHTQRRADDFHDDADLPSVPVNHAVRFEKAIAAS